MSRQSLKLYYEKEEKEVSIVKLSSSAKREERRLHYRMKTETPIEISLPGDDRFFNALTEDISCGGIKFSCNCDIEQHTIINLHFNFNGDFIQIISSVVHKMYSNNKDYIYSYGAEYTNISIDEQQKISQFILEEHRKRIKRKSIKKEPLI